MYVKTPAPQPAPGLELVQRIDQGIGSYYQTSTYWGTPAGEAGIRGLACACNGACEDCKRGFGLFDSGLDPSGWGWQEFAILAAGAWLVYSTLFTVRRGARAAREGASKRVKGVRRGIARRIEGKRSTRKK